MRFAERISQALHRLGALRRSEQIHDEIAEEIRFHVEQRAADEVRRGQPADASIRSAEQRFGRLTEMKERAYDARGAGWLESFVQDLSYGARSLRTSPVFTITATLTLALGIGANSAVFGVVEHVLLRPLAFQDADRLFVVREQVPEQSGMQASGPEFDDIHTQAQSFESVSAVIPRFTYTWTGDGEPRTVRCTGITYDFFPTLRIQPLMGRLYTPAEYHIDGVQVVISYQFWKTQLGGDPNVLGRVLHFSGDAQTVIGVMPDTPDLFPDVDVWAKNIPDFDFMKWRENRFLTVIGRLKRGVSPAQAAQEVTAILRRGPGESPQRSAVLVPLKDEVVGDVRTQLLIVMGAVLLVLIASSVNVTSMLMSRMSGRQAEIAIRMSVGARPVRLMRQFVTENLLLVSLGTALGLGIAAVVGGVANRMGAAGIPRAGAIGVVGGGGRALAFTLAVMVVLSIVLSLAPASVLGRIDLNAALKSGKVAARRWSSLRLLVACQASCAMVLLVAAGLLVRSFWIVQHVPPGFDMAHLLTASLRTINDSSQRGAYFDRILMSVLQTPGVERTAVANCMPASRTDPAALQFRDRAPDPSSSNAAETCWISADYFAAIGTPFLGGRSFNTADDEHHPPVAIVNSALAAKYWPGQSPIGKEIAVEDVGLGRVKPPVPEFRTVVGVVRDVKQEALDRPLLPAVYMPYHQDVTNHVYALMNIFVRTAGAPEWASGAVRKQINAVAATQPVSNMRTMDDLLSASLSSRRASLTMIGSFASLAIVLCAVGIYGMISYSLAQRTREFGVRIAIGATRQSLLRMVLRDGLRLMAIGVATGALVALVVARGMSGLLFGVAAIDPWTFAGAATLLLAVGAAACWIPAWRAASVDPVRAIRAG